MSNYTKATNFTAKDSLPSGNSGKIVKGAEIDTEFTAIASAISSKADSNSPTLTGTPVAPTAAAGTNTTQIATTAFVQNISGGLINNTPIGSTTPATGAFTTVSLQGTSTASAVTNYTNLGGLTINGSLASDGVVGIGATSGGGGGVGIGFGRGGAFDTYLSFYTNSAGNNTVGAMREVARFKDTAALELLSTSSQEGGQLDLQGGSSYSTFSKSIDVYQQDLRFIGSGNWTTQILSTTGTANLNVQGTVSASNLGLGMQGQTWNDVTGSRANGGTYTNSLSYPIAVSAYGTCGSTAAGRGYVDGVQIAFFQAQWNGCGGYGGVFFIVPPGSTYSVSLSNSLDKWYELR